MGTVNWKGEAFMQRMEAQYDARLGRAAEIVAAKQREFINTPYPPASSPGESPHKRTGNLQAKVAVTKPAPLVRRIGSSAFYALFLELGTRKMAPRPFLLKSLMETAQDVKNTVAGVEVTAFAEVGQ